MRTIVTSTVCAVAVILAGSACQRAPEDDQARGMDDQTRGMYEQRAEEPAGTAGEAARMPSVADIVANPGNYTGRTVTVEADLNEILGPRAFTLDEDAPFAGGIDRDLLVVGRQTTNVPRIDDQWLNNTVRVTGTVGRWSVVEVEREIGWDLDPQIEAELEASGAVLLADSVTRVQQ